jgi:hypothetical protein
MQLASGVSRMFLSIEKCVRWDGSVSCSWNHTRISYHTCSFLQTSCGYCKTHTILCSVEYRGDVINDEVSKLENTSPFTRREAWIAEVTLKHNTHDEHDGKTRLFVRLLIRLLQKWDFSLSRCSVENEDLSGHSAYIRRLSKNVKLSRSKVSQNSRTVVRHIMCFYVIALFCGILHLVIHSAWSHQNTTVTAGQRYYFIFILHSTLAQFVYWLGCIYRLGDEVIGFDSRQGKRIFHLSFVVPCIFNHSNKTTN